MNLFNNKKCFFFRMAYASLILSLVFIPLLILIPFIQDMLY